MMNKEWRDWTRINLERGCEPGEIQGILLSNHFSMEDIRSAMGPLFLASLTTPDPCRSHIQGTQADIDYLAMSRPRLILNPLARKVGDSCLQLYVIEDFLSSNECAELVLETSKQLRPSAITTKTAYEGFRTSSTCDLFYDNNKLVEKVDEKIASTLGIRLPWSETMQAQWYKKGQEFKAHTDYFEPNTQEFETYARQAGQRTWTFMVYLNEVAAGGHTHFTEIDQAFSPKAGRAVIWNNLLPDGQPNYFTKHHGMPVTEGEKVIITKWFRDKGKGHPFFPIQN